MDQWYTSNGDTISRNGRRVSGSVIVAIIHDLELQLDAARKDDAVLRRKFQRVRDWIKYAANSPGGICAELGGLIEETTEEPT